MRILTDSVEQVLNVHLDILLLMQLNHVFNYVQMAIIRIIYSKHATLVKEVVAHALTLHTVLYAIINLPFGTNFNVILIVLH
jgi:hypothetical protein